MGHLRHRAQDDQETDASQATGDQDRVAQDNARPDRENRCLGETDAERASELLRSLGEPPEPVVVLQQDEAALARSAQAAQPNGTPQLGEVHPVRRPLLSANQNYTPAALSPLRRQNPREEPGALAAHAGIFRESARAAKWSIGVPVPFLGSSISEGWWGSQAAMESGPGVACAQQWLAIHAFFFDIRPDLALALRLEIS